MDDDIRNECKTGPKTVLITPQASRPMYKITWRPSVCVYVARKYVSQKEC